MFAPQTINIRYGQDGNLAAAAAGAGRNAAYNRQKASDMSLINDEANRQQQNAVLAAQQQATQLQLAQQLSLSRIRGNPTSGMDRSNSPFQQAVQAAKQAAYTQAISRGDITPDDPEAQLAANSPDVNAGEMLRLIEGRKKTAANDQATNEDTQAKKAVVAAAKDTVDPEDADTISSFVDDPKLSIDGLRKVITASQQRRAKKESSTQQVQQRALSQQLQQGRASSSQALLQAKQLEKEHPEINFQGPPSQFGPEEGDSLAVYVAHQKLVMQAQDIQARGDALASGNASYPEGTLLHSPSTKRVFKVVNGQLQEITANASAGE